MTREQKRSRPKLGGKSVLKCCEVSKVQNCIFMARGAFFSSNTAQLDLKTGLSQRISIERRLAVVSEVLILDENERREY